MTILGVAAKQSDLRKMLLATGIGAVLGLQSCWLVNLVLGIPIPWSGLAWLFLSQALLGFAVGASESAPWWARGPVLGAIFSIPSAAVVWSRFERPGYAAAVAVAYSSSGLLTAFFIDAIFHRRAAVRPARRGPARTRRAGLLPMLPQRYPAQSVGRRLADAHAALEHLDAERVRLHDSRVGHAAEQRIVWNELIDLELQELDEQVTRICAPAAAEVQAAQPRRPEE